ncbi:EI24 domain-containing protein [Pontixanthobacter luteolus]|uniref:EI24 domain-containing protein n=1 Tax=Pontixanthobacter luteolus TaxID=295089 RepID=UPI0023047240|nr:EI24 domain-containing protein [Pontixanthobacter luteolus]
MTSVPSAISKAISQLGDPKILRVLLKTVLLTLAVFMLAGAGLWYAIAQSLAAAKLSFGPELGALLAVVLTAVGGWILFRIVALAILQFFADEIVLAVEQKHFPEHVGRARTLAWSEELRNSLRSIGRAIAVNLASLVVAIPLFFTAIGPAIVFWAANGWLLGRELQDMVWLRHRHAPSDKPPLGKMERFALGGIVTAILAIPFVNFLGPVIGAASAAHLVHSRLASLPPGANNAA